MAKHGIRHDYDLMAGAPGEARIEKCEICAQRWSVRWTDYHGEAVCRSCGAPYQLKGSLAEGVTPPALKLKPEWAAVLREYYEETGALADLGMYMGGPEPQGKREFFDWVEQRHPELVDGRTAER